VPTRHLAVRDGEPGSGQDSLEPLSDFGDGLNLIVDKEDLAAAADFAGHVVADEAVVPRRDFGSDFAAARRRGVNLRDVAEPGERHVERARNRGRGEGQHVDRGPRRPDAFLLPHPELLLFVDYQQAQIVVRESRVEQLVRADDDVNHARFQPGADFRLGRRGNEPREHLDPEREPGQALAERRVVLVAENRGWRKDRDLLHVRCRLESSPQGDFGLAIADVAADEPVHRARGFHVAFDVGHDLDLVRSLLVGE
jgi:hypothetical protein